jgi:triosephosphate isomerase
MKKLIVANWKMNPLSLKEAKRILNFKTFGKNEVVICPPFPFIPFIKKGIKTGAQDCFSEKKGSFTGEVSPFQLKNLGCSYVILGHSERRNYFKENDNTVNKKVKEALKAKLIPIICVGESVKKGRKDFVKKQLKKSLSGISNLKGIVFAYEPIWAIGSGNPASFKESREVRDIVKSIFPKNRILYGGSVNVSNAKGFLEEGGFDGLLIGGASLDKRFQEILKRI